VRSFPPDADPALHFSQIFWDATDDLWWKGALEGKFAGVFVSTGTAGGGQETTIINSISTLTNHGIIYVPLGYRRTLELFANLQEVHGGESLSLLRHELRKLMV